MLSSLRLDLIFSNRIVNRARLDQVLDEAAEKTDQLEFTATPLELSLHSKKTTQFGRISSTRYPLHGCKCLDVEVIGILDKLIHVVSFFFFDKFELAIIKFAAIPVAANGQPAAVAFQYFRWWLYCMQRQ